MAGTDSFNNSSSPKKGPNPFGDKSYSDSFVRATTAPLNAKKVTRPLNATAEMVTEKLKAVEEQINLCRVIIERFAQRMKVLKSAETLVRTGPAPAEPEPAPEATQAPGKPGLGKKPMGKPPAKPAAAPNPAMANNERAMATAIADRLRQDADLLRRAQIALFQFDDAQRAVQETASKLDPIRTTSPESAWDMIEALEVSKLQGKVYPICNFHEIFKRDPILSRVFPPPTGAPVPGSPTGGIPGGVPGTGPLAGPGPAPGAPAPGGSGPLGNLKGFFKK